jgi:hypothetical protein
VSLLPPKNKPGAVVPAIPPLDGIKDVPTREAIRAIADGLAVRNGHKGNGENRFITEADLKRLDFTKLGNLSLGAAALSGLSINPEIPRPGQIRAIIDDLASQIYESPLFRFLGEGVTLITKPTTGIIARLGASEIGLHAEIEQRVAADSAINSVVETRWAQTQSSFAAIQNAQFTLTNNFSALSQAVFTVQATVGQNTAAIAQESLARADADGNLYAQYTVKLDTNGYVSGFGLASTVRNGTYAGSEFYIRADRFAIASPTAPRSIVGYEVDGAGHQVLDPATHQPIPIYSPAPPANIPFIVQTTPWVDRNGATQPAGVYMRAAFIEFAAIDTARIRDAAVGTLKIQNDAVTIPVSAYTPDLGGTLPVGQGSMRELIRVVTDYSAVPGDSGAIDVLNSKYIPRARIITFVGHFDQLTGSGGQIWVRLQRWRGRFNSGTGQYEIDPAWAPGVRVFTDAHLTCPNNAATGFPLTILDTDLPWPANTNVGLCPMIFTAHAWLADASATIAPKHVSITVLGAKR